MVVFVGLVMAVLDMDVDMDMVIEGGFGIVYCDVDRYVGNM